MKIKVPTTLRSAMVEIGKIRRDYRLVLWSMFIIFFPFYVFPSGMPQPADWLLILLAPTLLGGVAKTMPTKLRVVFVALVAFTIYAVLENMIWSVLLGSFTFDAKEGFLLSPTFYIYNTVMFLCFILMFQRYGEVLLWLTARVALVSVCLQVALSFVMRSSHNRSTLMFNNPNQLGYYALLSACLLLIGQRRLRLTTLQVSIGLVASSYLALMSASKAALATVAMLTIALMLGRVRTMMFALVAVAALAFTSNPFSDALDRAEERIVNDQSKNFVEERGYDRILNNPEYTVLGAGEGGYKRFADTTALGGAHEIHSSAGTLIFCYGIIGTALFGVFLWRVVKGAGIRTWIVVAPAFAYGMTHQGLRVTLLWVLLGMAAALKTLPQEPDAGLPVLKGRKRPKLVFRAPNTLT